LPGSVQTRWLTIRVILSGILLNWL
jgi:hypothetical protein